MANMTNFGLKQRWLKAGMIATALMLLAPVTSNAQTVIYISPGVQLSYGPDQGLAFSAQATLGLVMDKPILIVFLIPGITFGKRWSKQETMTYLDAQLSYIFFGAGVGKVWIRKKGNLGRAPGFRLKVWGGYFLNFTIDGYRVEDNPPSYHQGVIGVIPIPLFVGSNGSVGV